MNPWYRRCLFMAVAALGISLGNALGTPTFGAQMGAGVLLVGAGVLAYMTKTTP